MKIFFLGQKVVSLKPIFLERTYEINGRKETDKREIAAGTPFTVNYSPKTGGAWGMVSYYTPVNLFGPTEADWVGTQKEAEELFEPVWLSLDHMIEEVRKNIVAYGPDF